MSSTTQAPIPTPQWDPTGIMDKLKHFVSLYYTDFEKAVYDAHSTGVVEYKHITTVDQWLRFMESLLHWVPHESGITSQDVLHKICASYFVFDQPSVKQLQTAILPQSEGQPLTPLSNWIVMFAQQIGLWLDQPGSLTAESVQSFYNNGYYTMWEYERPAPTPQKPLGWGCYNEFFARTLIPGARPISGPDDDTLIVSPADTHVDDWFPISPENTITVTGEGVPDSGPTINCKGITWKISELLQDSPFKDEFEGGMFYHAFLNTYNYHRQHAPCSGTIVESRVIQGAAWLNVVVETGDSGKNRLGMNRDLNATDNTGYQFLQARGLIIIDNPRLGKVAVLPIGMAQVSSVVTKYHVLPNSDITLPRVKKGDEISHFQFGGSDVVVVFGKQARAKFTVAPKQPAYMGSTIAVQMESPQY